MQMQATVRRTVRIGASIYDVEAGDVVDVDPRHVDRLSAFGFRPVDGSEESDPQDLEEAPMSALRELATRAEIEGRSRMNREELLEALRDGQEA